jgi:hypothetical protein
VGFVSLEGVKKWQEMVRKLRSLRETLVSLHELSDFTRRGQLAPQPAAECRHPGSERMDTSRSNLALA